MPIIVPIEDNKVGLATATDAKFRAPDYSGSGLEALGAGLAQLGGDGQKLASGLEERRRRAAEAIAAAMLDDRHQSNIDDAAVKQAYVDYSDPTHEALHGEDGLFNRQGAGAHAAFPGLVETLVDNHDKALSKLDDVQRAAIAPAMNERLRNDVDRAADYVRQQGAAEQKWQSEQLQKAAARDAVNHADDPDLFDHHLATGEKTIRQQAKIDKVRDKLLAKQIADYKSGVHADTIDALTQRDPVHAAGWYARYGDALNQQDRLRVEAKLGPALAGAHAVADVDVASNSSDPTAAPRNPHDGNDATLLLKMQGITPMMDQTELSALMRRYGNDPAKAWAAFVAGPGYLDRLIATKGDDWYASVGDDVRHFVSQNIARLDASNSARTAPDEPQAAAAAIAVQADGDVVRARHALNDLNWRIAQANGARRGVESGATKQARATGEQPSAEFTSLAQVDPVIRPALPVPTSDALTLKALGKFPQEFAPTQQPLSDTTGLGLGPVGEAVSWYQPDQNDGQAYSANASWAVDGASAEPAADEMSDAGESAPSTGSPAIANRDRGASTPSNGIIQRPSILSPGNLRARASAMNIGNNALIKTPNLNVVLFGPGVSLVPIPVATFEEFDAAAKLASRLFDLDAVITGAQSGYLTGSLGMRGQSVIDGRVYGNSAPDRYYLATMIGGDGVSRLTFGKGDPPRTEIKAGFGGGIPLLIDGKDVPGYNAAWRRYDESSRTGKNIVAYNSKLNITAIFIQPHGRDGGSLSALREYIRKSGYNYALMFDGSGSTSLSYRGHQVISPDLIRQPLIVAGIGFKSK
jgi:hypothetical protein